MRNRKRKQMRNAALFAALFVVAAASGCKTAATREPAPIVIESEADYDTLWRASLDVVGSRFMIASAEKDEGLIETEYLVGALSKTALKSNAVTTDAVLREFLHTTRRRAAVRLCHSDAAPLEVRVDTACLIREHPDIARGGTFYAPGSAEERAGAFKTRWVDTGRDEALENVITAEITRAYNSRL